LQRYGIAPAAVILQSNKVEGLDGDVRIIIESFSKQLTSSVLMREVINITEAFQTEGVAVSKLDCLNRGDRCVINDETLPLPWRGIETEQVANQHAVCASMCKERESLPWFINMPNR
jgi:hypothetical protein